MTRSEMASYLDYLQKIEREVREEGQKEYAREDENAFANFERVGQLLNLSREEVLFVFLYKHIDAIISYMQGHQTQREPIEGRIKDARMYLALLGGMFEESANKDDDDWQGLKGSS